METERFLAEPILYCERNHWQVIEQTCGLDIVRCETFDRRWAELIAGLLNEQPNKESKQ